MNTPPPVPPAPLPFREWQVGDELIKITAEGLNPKNFITTITEIADDGERRVTTTDEDGGTSWMDKGYAEYHYRWLSRPNDSNSNDPDNW